MELLINWFYQMGWKILVIIGLAAVIYLIIGHVVPLVVGQTVSQRMRNKPTVEIEKRAATIVRLITSVSAVIIAITTVFLILQQFIDITPALAGLGIVGIAVGFGAQYLVRDLIAGFFVFLENQYNVGDVIKVGSIGGIVEELSLRRTILRDLDGARHIVPNGEIRIVSNLTQDWSRANLSITVSYKEDLDRVMALMRKTWEEMSRDPAWASFILVGTPSLLRVDEFGGLGAIIKMVGETQPMKQWDVTAEFRRRIKKVFDQEDIVIPCTR